MKYVNLNQPFKVDIEKNPTTPPDRELTLDWIANALGYGYKNGLPSDARRIFVNILEKIENTKKMATDYFEMNAVEEVFILKAFSQLVCSPNEAKWINLAEDAIKGAVTEDKLPSTDPLPPSTSNSNVTQAKK